MSNKKQTIGNVYTSQDRKVVIVEKMQDENKTKVKNISITHMIISDTFFIERFGRSQYETVRMDTNKYSLYKVKDEELFLNRLKSKKNDLVLLEETVEEIEENEMYSILSDYSGGYFYLIAKLQAK